jgi:simple sugar transport system permease protein
MVIFGGLSRLGDVFYFATPILMTGLAVGFAFKMGLFNIGASGQYTMGMFFALYVGFMWKLPASIHWIVAIIAGMIGGMIWGFIPGIFKALVNVNEVITSIMFNYIGMYLVDMLIQGNSVMYIPSKTRTSYLPVAAQIPSLGVANSNVNLSIFIAIALAILLHVILNKTTFGYELKACGSNKNAAKYAGMNEKRNIVLSMAIAGALSAAGAAMYYLQGDIEFYWHTSMSLPATGFNGIPVALLANCNPIGTIFAGMFMAYLNISGNQLSTYTAYNEYIANIIIAVIVYLSAFTLFFKGILNGKGWNAAIKNDEKMSTDSKPVDEANNAEEGGK